jgi:hypothetical protein
MEKGYQSNPRNLKFYESTNRPCLRSLTDYAIFGEMLYSPIDNTSEPHLHIHAQKANIGKSILDEEVLPIAFDDKFLTRNSVFYQ